MSNETVTAAIERLRPHTCLIVDAYRTYIDPTPVCGWLAMFHELMRVAEDKRHPHREKVAVVVSKVFILLERSAIPVARRSA